MSPEAITTPTPQAAPPAEKAEKTEKAASAGSGRFSVYDTGLLRFVGPVTNDKKAAQAYAKDQKASAGRDTFEVREV